MKSQKEPKEQREKKKVVVKELTKSQLERLVTSTPGNWHCVVGSTHQHGCSDVASDLPL